MSNILQSRPHFARSSIRLHHSHRSLAIAPRTMINGHQIKLHKDIDHILFSQEKIATRIQELGRQIAAECQDDKPLFLAALNGACIFLSDGVNVDFIRASSYTTVSTAAATGNVKIGDLSQGKFDVKDRNVIIVEDIVDSGHTAKKLKQYLIQSGARSVRLVALLDKSERRSCDVEIDYLAFWCPDEFVVGYGMDYDENYRTLPYVGVLKPELYQG